MGLTIFYSGRLRHAQQIPAITTELLDLCDQLKWPCDEFHPLLRVPLQGMWFSPPDADKIWMTFLPSGVLSEPEYMESEEGLRAWINSRWKDNLMECRMQYAGPDAHIDMVRLMKYISQKYFSHFHLTDESEYWETGNEEKCRDWFTMFGVWMDQMSADLGTLDGRGHEGGTSLQERYYDLMSQGKFDEVMKAMKNPYRKTWKNGKWINGYGVR